MELATGTSPISNCSDSSTPKVAELIRRTDAAYEGFIRAGDRLMANNQWVAWIDTQEAPGILRGLWGVDAGTQFVGVLEPEIAADAAKSVVSIARGYASTDAPYGYKGLHIEIWKTRERSSSVGDECAPANCLYTVPNDVGYAETPGTLQTSPSHAAANYHTPLVNLLPPKPGCPTCGTTTFVGLNGASTQLIWNVTYLMTPTSFTISTALGALADVELSGAAGGLMLLLNPGCRATARNAYRGDRHFRGCDPGQVAERALHRVEGPGIGAGRATRSSERIPVDGDVADMFAPGFQDIAPDDDRFINQHDDASPYTFRYGDGRIAMTATPAWDAGEQTNDWVTGFATHFNSRPRDLGHDARRGLSGVSGIASVDAYTEPAAAGCPGPCTLAVGPTRGVLVWRMDLSR